MNWDRNLSNLRDVLAGLFPTYQDSRLIVLDAGLNPIYIAISSNNKPIINWMYILEEAKNRNKVQAIIEAARRVYPENQWLVLAQQGNLQRALKGPDIEDDLAWDGPENTRQLEKIIGTKSTLLPISFLEIGLTKACSVVRVVRGDGAIGSGFLTGDNFIITNHHVLPTPIVANNAIAQFNYQQTAEGLFAQREDFKLSPQDFETSREDDWTAVRVIGNPSQKWGMLKLVRRNPKVQDRVNVIQHPGGGPKQIALYHNVVVYVGGNRLQYLTDTLPGSSGSPVFDSDWQVVALHHSGGWLREPNSKRTYYRNEGIHINTIIEGLTAKGIYSA